MKKDKEEGGFKLKPEDYGKKIVNLGKSGSGKSYTTRVLIEDGLDAGVTFLVIDPQAAYENLPGFYYIKASEVNKPFDLGMLLAKTSKNVVISTKGMINTEQQEFVKALLQGYRKHGQKGIRMVIIDECHKFAPEYDKTVSKEEVRSMSQENRSDGLGFAAVEQRSQRLDKTVLSQADILIIHKLTAKRDLMAVEGYLDDPKRDLAIIKNLSVGEAYIVGFKDEPFTQKIRKARTKHSGEAPTNLLTEEIGLFNKHIKHVYGGSTMSEKVSTQGEPVKKIIPSMNGFGDLAMMGVKMSVGRTAAAAVGAFASRFKSPIPYVSSRTLGSGATTVLLYAGYRHAPEKYGIKETVMYACAGSAIHTAGSLLYDGLAVFNVRLPVIANAAIGVATGVAPYATEGEQVNAEPGEGDVDVSTRFA